MTECVIDLFSEQTVLNGFSDGIKSKDELCKLSRTLLHVCTNVRNAKLHSQDFAQVFGLACCEPIKAMFQRLERLARCVLHAFCSPPTSEGYDYDGPALNDNDVIFFSKFDGPDLMEKCLCRMMSESTWWKNEISDMLRKGASAALNHDKVTELSGLLGSSSLTSGSLSQALDLLKQVRDSTRSQQLAGIMDSFAETCSVHLYREFSSCFCVLV